MSEYEKEQVLIDIIQHYPFLFNKSSKDFKDNNKKSNAWDTIATAMSSSVEDLQKLWKNLRERYAKERKIIKNIASGSEAPDCAWPLYKYMGFMEKHIVTRKRVSNVSRPQSGSGFSTTSSPLISPIGDAPISPWNTLNTVQSHEDNTEGDADFTSIEEQESQDQMDCEEMSQPPKKIKANEQPSTSGYGKSKKGSEVPSTSGLKTLKKSYELPSTSGLKSKTSTTHIVEESLGQITSFLQERQKPDKNSSFGQYVGLSLSEMPTAEQNYKKLKIVEILNEQFES